ncbi:hypothetical protein [Hyphomicrobium sp.]|uniref:hypothetical protein n=1 Tax=Hyphomicrobium sp. TaxID=82 RepID=UPI001DB0EF71|nr:hypothetical protein [Hyphomicrobium sp.]MBY0561423.1 hypothetical protein [Hyphomicrobium sp.]
MKAFLKSLVWGLWVAAAVSVTAFGLLSITVALMGPLTEVAAWLDYDLGWGMAAVISGGVAVSLLVAFIGASRWLEQRVANVQK